MVTHTRTQFLPEADQLTARDTYWRAVTCCTEPHQHDEALRLLRTAAWHNPHVAEPHVLIAQVGGRAVRRGCADLRKL